jgi:hypothetical protein
VRVVIALGGNALLRRGESADVSVQRRNVAVAARVVASIARDHQVVVTHGNGPQVGLLALQAEAYEPVHPYPLDVLGAESEGMIGYLLEQELSNQLPGRSVATSLTRYEARSRPPSHAHGRGRGLPPMGNARGLAGPYDVVLATSTPRLRRGVNGAEGGRRVPVRRGDRGCGGHRGSAGRRASTAWRGRHLDHRELTTPTRWGGDRARDYGPGPLRLTCYRSPNSSLGMTSPSRSTSGGQSSDIAGGLPDVVDGTDPVQHRFGNGTAVGEAGRGERARSSNVHIDTGCGRGDDAVEDAADGIREDVGAGDERDAQKRRRSWCARAGP